MWVAPEFQLNHLLGIGLPLVVATMTSQNLPGITTLRVAGYRPRIAARISWTGIATLLLAPFGGYALNLVVITAAICAGEAADNDPAQRYESAVLAGLLYTLMGIFSAAVITLFALLPLQLILSIAGLALLGTIGTACPQR